MKILDFFKHRIGYAAQAALLCGLLGAYAPAQAAINYLVIQTPTPSYVSTKVVASIATACPTGYQYHTYGSNDIQQGYFNLGWGSYYVSSISPSLAAGICVVGVPSSITATLLYADAGSTTTPTTTSTITSGGASVVLTGYTQAVNTGNWTTPVGLVLLFPDNFMVLMGAASGNGANSYVFAEGMLAQTLLMYSSYGAGSYGIAPFTNSAPGFSGLAAAYSVSGGVLGQSGIPWNIGVFAKHLYVIGY